MIFSPAILSGWLGNQIAFEHAGADCAGFDGTVFFLNGHERKLTPDCLYIGTPGQVLHALRAVEPAGSCYYFAVAGYASTLEAEPLPAYVCLTATTMDTVALFNTVQQHVRELEGWDRSLREAVFGSKGLQTIAETAFSELKSTVMILNAGYKSLAACYKTGKQDALSEELQANGYFAFDTVKELTHAIEDKRKLDPRAEYVQFSSERIGKEVILWPVDNNGVSLARIIVVPSGAVPAEEMLFLCRLLADYLKQSMLSANAVPYAGSAAMNSLVADLINARLTDPEEIKERLKQVPLMFKSYYHLLVVTFAVDGSAAFMDKSIPAFGLGGGTRPVVTVPWYYIVSELQQQFPFSNIAIYNNEILIIARKSTPSPRFTFDTEAVSKILASYGGYMSVGNFSKFLTSLGSVYRQTRAVTRIATVMNKTPGQRVFYYEDYAVYHTIELAATGLNTIYGNSNYVYLCHPGIISLLRYDRKHEGNLVRVLQVYLITDRNAAEAARMLYMHRNTMLYKISKIEEIIGESLDDPMLRARLMYSCYVLEYVREYLKIDILQLRQNKPAEK